MIRRRLGDPQRGSAATELLILAPVLMLVIMLVTLAGRTGHLHVAVDSAASNAARAASIERTPAAARAAAEEAVTQTLDQEGLDCGAKAVQVDVADIAKPAGETGTVRVNLSCTTSVPGVPGARTVTADAASPVDTYRAGPAG